MQNMPWDEKIQQINPGSWSSEKTHPQKNSSSSQARAKRAVLLLIFFKAAPVLGRFGSLSGETPTNAWGNRIPGWMPPLGK